VNQDGYGELQIQRARVGDLLSLRKRLWLRVLDSLLPVGIERPAVGRMRLANVDDQKRGAVSVLLIQRFQATCLATERGSGIAAEDEHARARRAGRAQNNGPHSSKRSQR